MINLYPYLLVKHIKEKYFKINSGNKLLDIGCGNGIYVWIFEKLGYEAYGVDKNTEKCRLLLDSANLNKIKEIDLEKEKIPFEDNYFDFIFSKSTIEHIYNTENFMKEAYRVLKPNGKIVILTPDYESRYKDFFEHWQHVKPFTLKSLWSCLEEFGFKNVKVEKFYQLPLLWKCPYLKFLAKLTAMLIPDRFKYKDKKQTIHRTWVRFSKEVMLLGYGEKEVKDGIFQLGS